MKHHFAPIWAGILGLSLAPTTSHAETPNTSTPQPPALITGSAPSLQEQQAAIESNNPEALQEALELIERADQALLDSPPSVTDKTQTPPSGDKHDYLSISPYWWPDPAKDDGLPWIRRDGQRNPENRGEHVDYDQKNRFFNSTDALARAAYLTGDSKYADAGAKYLEHWFVHPETRMNPNLNYAQGIPGSEEGRSFGIIEWRGIDKVLSAIQILESMNHLSAETIQTLDEWFTKYAAWLQTSELGVLARNAENNHGTWYDAQLVSILLFLDKDEEAKRIINEASKKRIASQIEPDGSQPHELARTKSWSYSQMNLRGLIQLADYGKRLGVDLWNFETPDGRSIRKAQQFLEPYAQGREKWPYQEIE